MVAKLTRATRMKPNIHMPHIGTYKMMILYGGPHPTTPLPPAIKHNTIPLVVIRYNKIIIMMILRNFVIIIQSIQSPHNCQDLFIDSSMYFAYYGHGGGENRRAGSV